MSEPNVCPACGGAIPAEAPGGACPKCLLRAGLDTAGGPPPERMPSPAELAPLFPNLEIGELLGRGGMGVVYRARHRALDRDVALKILPSWVAADRAFADRFQREARALAKLQHPHIVAVHDFGQVEGHFWLLMEYVDGVNIRQAMRTGSIGAKEALAIVPQICDALQYAHEHGVVHRDIKPENVLLDKAGHVKVADFGLAKLMQHGAADATLTGAGQVMGTPHYMAPEQVEHPADVDHRADIYSLGVVFYEMLTGELPLGRFAAPSSKSAVDARIDEIVLRTLEKEREARYQHVVEVKTDVGRVASGAQSVGTTVVRTVPLDLVRREWWFAWALIVFGSFICMVWGEEPLVLLVPLAGVGLLATLWWRARNQLPASAESALRPAPWTTVLAALAAIVPLLILSVTLASEMRRVAGISAVLVGVLYLIAVRRSSRPATGTKSPMSLPAKIALGALALFLLCGLGMSFVLVSGNPVERGASEFPFSFSSGSDMPISAIAVDQQRRRAEWLFSQAVLFRGTPAVQRLYTPAAWAEIQALSPELRRARGEAGNLGLPLISAEELPEPLRNYRITSFVASRDHASFSTGVLTLRGERSMIRAPLRYDPAGIGSAPAGLPARIPASGWFFDAGPVEIGP